MEKIMDYSTYTNSKKTNEGVLSFLVPQKQEPKIQMSEKERAEMENAEEELKDNIEDFDSRIKSMEKSLSKIKKYKEIAIREDHEFFASIEDLDVNLMEFADYLEGKTSK